MAKRSPQKTRTARTSRKSPAKKPRSISTATKIKRLDAELVKLLQQRADLLLDAVRREGKLSSATTALDGDDRRLSQLARKSRGPMPANAVRAVLREVAGGCRSLVRTPVVAVPGPAYGFAHLAAIRHFGRGAECVPVEGAAAAIEEVACRQADYGLVPLDGVPDGRLAAIFESLLRGELAVCGKVVLPIRYSLQGRCSRSDVREVYGVSAALAECRGWLAGHLPVARPIEVTGAATACQLAAEKPGAAVVASREAGYCHNLDVLAENVENAPPALVRFAVVGGRPPPRTKDDRVALLIRLDRCPDALADVLAEMKREKLNLAWIESLQDSVEDEHGLFFLEIEGHQSDKRLCRKLASLEKKTLRLATLGSYPAPTPME
ncbi:MAG: prephenate dehydratase [Pirellulales bacterium]|nr:prephenate dehydratase [Pirellulales bacterium]